MERASNSKVPIKIPKMLLLFLLPNATSSMAFLSPPPSPHKAPRVPIIPIQARRRRRRSKNPNNGISSFDSTKEPTSPQVSCLGQVKKKKPGIRSKPTTKLRPNMVCCAVAVEDVVKPPRVVKGQKKVDFDFEFEFDKNKVNDVFENVEIKIPPLSQMRRFDSGRRGELFDFQRTNDQ